VTAIGLGFYMFHNTLQTKATQMTPEARGTAVAIFSSALYFGQTAGSGSALLSSIGWGRRRFFSARRWASRRWRFGLRANCDGASL
jgi:predicted MFS family arabinose efflux permease